MQLELIGFSDVFHYMRGKADWIVRGLPTEPRAPIGERLRALPYFVNNLAPGFRAAWIRFSGRVTVARFTRDDLKRISPDDRVEEFGAMDNPCAVVIDARGVLLGAIEQAAEGSTGGRAIDVMNPAPQTIRPDMTIRLAAALLSSNPYILVTDASGRYIGRYEAGGGV